MKILYITQLTEDRIKEINLIKKEYDFVDFLSWNGINIDKLEVDVFFIGCDPESVCFKDYLARYLWDNEEYDAIVCIGSIFDMWGISSLTEIYHKIPICFSVLECIKVPLSAIEIMILDKFENIFLLDVDNSVMDYISVMEKESGNLMINNFLNKIKILSKSDYFSNIVEEIENCLKKRDIIAGVEIVL